MKKGVKICPTHKRKKCFHSYQLLLFDVLRRKVIICKASEK